MQLRVGLGQPAPVIHAVGDILEFLRRAQPCGVEHVLAQNIGVECGNAVDREAGGHAQVGHAHFAAPDDGHLLKFVLVAMEELPQLGQIAVIDLTQDHPDAGQQLLHQILGPALQRLGQNGVVGVCHGVGGDIPGVVPAHALLIQQQAHHLGDDQRGMGVVDLDDVLFVEVIQGAVVGQMLAEDGLNGGGDKEVLLLQPQTLALAVVVSGVEHLGDDLSHGLRLYGAQILAGGVVVHIHGSSALGLPQAQVVYEVGLITGDLHVIGDSQHGCEAALIHDAAAVFPVGVHLAAKADGLGLGGVRLEPGVPQLFPGIGQLDLLAVNDLLFEDAQFIADGVAGGGDLQRGHGVQIAGGQTPQTAVAQTGVRFQLEEVGSLEAQLVDGLLQLGQHPEVERVLFKGASHEELQREIVHFAHIVFRVAGAGGHAELRHDVTNDLGAGLKHLLLTGIAHIPAKAAAQLFGDELFEIVLCISHREPLHKTAK